MHKKPWENYFFPPKKQPRFNKFAFLRKLVQDLSPEAKLRLEWIIFYETVGKKNASKTAKYFGISRKTFIKPLTTKHL